MYRIQSEGGIADHKSNVQAQLSFSPGNRISLLMPSIIILRSAQWGPANPRIFRVNYLHDFYCLQRRRSSRIIKLGYRFTCSVTLNTLFALRGNGRLWWSRIYEHDRKKCGAGHESRAGLKEIYTNFGRKTWRKQYCLGQACV